MSKSRSNVSRRQPLAVMWADGEFRYPAPERLRSATSNADSRQLAAGIAECTRH